MRPDFYHYCQLSNQQVQLQLIQLSDLVEIRPGSPSECYSGPGSYMFIDVLFFPIACQEGVVRTQAADC